MISVELIYDADCPNVSAARQNLKRACTEARISARWTEWIRSAPETPRHLRAYGSPTILVNGRDVAGMAPCTNPCCRIYGAGQGQVKGVPSWESISQKLKLGIAQNVDLTKEAKTAWKRHLPVAPAVFLALLSKLGCPACWPAYAGLFSSVGLGALASSTYLLPLTMAFFAASLGALLWRAKERRGYGPFMLGGFATAIVLAEEIVYPSAYLLYGGLTTLIAASLWNTWPIKVSETVPCISCAPTGDGDQPGSAPEPKL